MTHPSFQSGWLDAPHRALALGDFALESGSVIEDFELSYVVHGDPSRTRLPIVLGLCAIGSSHHRLDFLIGPGRALDPRDRCVIIVDAIGNGLTTSPSTSTIQAGWSFPEFTIRDMVRSQKSLLEHLGCDMVDVVGASMGGMQALQWAVSYPGTVRKVAALTPMAKTSAWAGAMNSTMRNVLEAALGEQATLSPDSELLRSWCTLMQLLCTQTPERVDGIFAGPADLPAWRAAQAQQICEQGFQAIDWICQSKAYDAHDVGKTEGFEGDTEAALRSIRAEVLIAAPQLDLYNPVHAAAWAAERIPNCGQFRIPGNAGHLAATASDADAAHQLNAALRSFLNQPVCDGLSPASST